VAGRALAVALLAFHCAVALHRRARLLFLAVVSSSDFFPGVMHIAMLYYRQSGSNTPDLSGSSPSLRENVSVGARVVRSGEEGLYGRPLGWGNVFAQREQASDDRRPIQGE
jgi:hypothetical protein